MLAFQQFLNKMIAFFLGVLVGAGIVLFIIYVLVVDPWGPISQPPTFIEQFKPIQVPDELKQFLKSGKDGQGISSWESCFSLSLFLHMFYQEHKDTRTLRRWMHKRLQMELNDIATRSAAGRLLQDIRIRDLSLGTKFPVVKAIRVEKVEMSDDKNTFQNVTFLVDIDYTGGFETSIDVATMFGKKANLSVKITKLAGTVRFILSRKPYNHWTMSFVTAPQLETDISSQIQGHQLKRLIPLIKDAIRRALQRKHVWPNFKIRYRPVFPNPLLQASPPLSAFAHIKLEGGLEVTVLQCSRLKTDLVNKNENWEVYCTLTMDQRPFIQNTSHNVAHALSVMLVFSRYDLAEPIGITFEKYSSSSQGAKPVRVANVDEGSLADKALFKPGDILVAINNVPIRGERQATRFLQQTTGDLMVLVERNLDDLDDDDIKESEEIIGNNTGDTDEAFVSLDFERGRSSRKMSTTTTSSNRRHSVSVGPSLPSVASLVDTTDSHSVGSSLLSLGFENSPGALIKTFVYGTQAKRHAF
ncbi:unnamed protein product [Auanema sp. JU1783]|nr:unnamed protein product [Auanema sp. JU1783]